MLDTQKHKASMEIEEIKEYMLSGSLKNSRIFKNWFDTSQEVVEELFSRNIEELKKSSIFLATIGDNAGKENEKELFVEQAMKFIERHKILLETLHSEMMSDAEVFHNRKERAQTIPYELKQYYYRNSTDETEQAIMDKHTEVSRYFAKQCKQASTAIFTDISCLCKAYKAVYE